ncbi:hypothetical protein BDF19DRAFT_392006 [Syncephalis fuscata]|nr:hypothetical protein BDF19DRAFT_392006 [Syncephalis fuscata]
MEELRAVQGALRECRALVHRREASAARKDTAEVHRCTQDARRRLQGLAEQVRALEAGLKVLTIRRAEKIRRQDMLEGMRADLRTLTRLVEGRPSVAGTDRRELLQQDGMGNAYGYNGSDRSSRPSMPRSATAGSSSSSAVTAPQSRRVFGRSTATLPESDATRPLDNNELLQHQQLLMQRQDDQVAQFSDVIQRQRHIALAVGDELDMQNQMLDELDADVERVASKLGRAGRQLDKIH